MSKRLDSKRLINKYHQRGLDLLMGDAAGDTALALSAISELSKAGGAVAAEQATKQETERKKKELADAQAELIKAKSAVQKADLIEKDKTGPLHLAAQQQLIEAQAKFAAIMPGSLGDLDSSKDKKHATTAHPWWMWPAIIGGVGVAGLVGYKLLHKKGR